MLAIQLVSAFLFYAFAIVSAILYPSFGYIIGGMYLLRLVVQLIIYTPAMKKLQVKGLIWGLPFLDIFYYVYICVNGFFALYKKDVQWK